MIRFSMPSMSIGKTQWGDASLPWREVKCIIQTIQQYLQFPFIRYALVVGTPVTLCSLLLGVTLGMGIRGFWYGNALSGLVPFLIGSGYLLSGKWKKRASDKSAQPESGTAPKDAAAH